MPRTPSHPARLLDPLLLWADLALKSAEMLVASGQVIGSRVEQMARAGANPSASDLREMHLMGSEKLKAATASGLAVARRLGAAPWPHAMAAWPSGGWPAAAHAWHPWWAGLGALASLGHAALMPVHAAATANARRLAGRKGGRTA
jgi:hypothetical protein